MPNISSDVAAVVAGLVMEVVATVRVPPVTY